MDDHPHILIFRAIEVAQATSMFFCISQCETCHPFRDRIVVGSSLTTETQRQEKKKQSEISSLMFNASPGLLSLSLCASVVSEYPLMKPHRMTITTHSFESQSPSPIPMPTPNSQSSPPPPKASSHSPPNSAVDPTARSALHTSLDPHGAFSTSSSHPASTAAETAFLQSAA